MIPGSGGYARTAGPGARIAACADVTAGCPPVGVGFARTPSRSCAGVQPATPIQAGWTGPAHLAAPCARWAVALPAPLAAPLVPSREEARGWAVEELADPVYARAQPGLLERAVGWLLDRLAGLRLRADLVPDPRTGLVLLVLVGLLVVGLVVVRTGRLRGPSRVADRPAVFAGAVLSAERHRQLADEAAARGDWAGAVRERFRAVVRNLEERTVLDERPGRTADEAAAEAAQALPDLAAALAGAARLFDEVTYGGRPAAPEHDSRLRSLDAAVAAARPVHDSAHDSPHDPAHDPTPDRARAATTPASGSR